MAVFLARIVMPRSRSSTFESMTRSGMTARVKRARLLQELVDEGGLAMIDVGDDGDVAQILGRVRGHGRRRGAKRARSIADRRHAGFPERLLRAETPRIWMILKRFQDFSCAGIGSTACPVESFCGAGFSAAAGIFPTTIGTENARASVWTCVIIFAMTLR